MVASVVVLVAGDAVVVDADVALVTGCELVVVAAVVVVVAADVVVVSTTSSRHARVLRVSNHRTAVAPRAHSPIPLATFIRSSLHTTYHSGTNEVLATLTQLGSSCRHPDSARAVNHTCTHVLGNIFASVEPLRRDKNTYANCVHHV